MIVLALKPPEQVNLPNCCCSGGVAGALLGVFFGEFLTSGRSIALLAENPYS
jgi:hypothetical protein